jgi:CubicO group peptidase (beta-lactamase class C family)
MRPILRYALAVALPFLPADNARTEPDAPSELRPLIERLESRAVADLAKDPIGGLTIGIVSGGQLAWTRSYGWSDMEAKAPATRATVYRIGSMTKQFTALMLLQLVEAGKVHLSDPAEKYFPEVNKLQGRPPGAPPVTLVQLATHTSGIDREPEGADPFLKGQVADWEKTLIAALPHTRYIAEPGTRYSYSNMGYAILGAALGRAAGQPYVEYVREHIFRPLGMSHTVFELDDHSRAAIAKGYLQEDGKVDFSVSEREHRQGRGYKVPNGAVYTTVDDLARFVAFEMGTEVPEVLKPQAWKENFTRLVATNGNFQGGYGVGFQVVRLGDTVLYGHDGAVAGYQAAAFFERRTRTGVIVLRNEVGGSLDPDGLISVAFGKDPARP